MSSKALGHVSSGIEAAMSELTWRKAVTSKATSLKRMLIETASDAMSTELAWSG